MICYEASAVLLIVVNLWLMGLCRVLSLGSVQYICDGATCSRRMEHRRSAKTLLLLHHCKTFITEATDCAYL